MNRSDWISRISLFAAILTIAATSAMAQNLLVLGQNSFNFATTVGSTTVQQQTLYIGTSSTTNVSYSATIQQTGSWLSISPATWTTPVTASIFVNPTGLSQNTYVGTISFAASGVTNSPQTVTVILTVSPQSTSTTLTASTNALSFSYISGGTVPSSQSVVVTSASTLTFYASASTTSGGSWLTVTPTTATTPGTIAVSVSPAALAQGTYYGTIVLSPGGFFSTTTTISVTLTVSTTPELKVSTLQPFNYQVGTTAVPASQTLSLTSSGAALTFTASATTSSGGNWLVLSSTSGATAADLTVSISPGLISGLPIGTYTGEITINAAAASNPTTTVTVKLNISTAPFVSTSPASLSFSISPGGALPATKSLAITSSTSGIRFVAASASNWLTVTPTDGTTPGTITVGLTSAAQSMVSGTYTGSLTINTFGTDNPSMSVPVTLTVTTTPALAASPTALYFNYQVGYSTPTAQTVSVSSSGIPTYFTVSTSTTTGSGWLSVTTSSNTTPAVLTVSVVPTSLAVETYTGTITLTPATSGVSPITISVSLTVSNTPLLNVSPAALTFNVTQGSGTTSQNVALTTTGAALQYTSTYSTLSGGSGWLLAGPVSGSTPANLTVYVLPGSLAVGVYTGTVTVTGINANTQTITVTLNVTTSTTIAASPATLTFTQAQGATAASPQTLTLSTSGTTSGVPYSVTATTTTCGSWLTLDTASGTTPATVRVIPLAVSFGAGTSCYGVITIQAPTASNSPLTVSVTLTVTANTGTTAAVSKTSLSFTQTQGTTAAAPQSLALSASGLTTSLAFTASATGTTCGSWLTLSQTSGTTPATITVTPLAVSYSAGTTCYGQVTFVVPGASNSTVTVPVTLTVTALQTLTVSPAALSFSYQIGGSAPSTQTVQLTTSSPVAFAVSNSTQTGGNWLNAAASASTTPATITVGILTANAAVAGTYTGNVIIASSAASNSPLTIPVTLTVTAAAVVTPRLTALRNGASYIPGSVAPGEIVYLEGVNIGPPALTTLRLNAQGRVDTTLGDTRVLFDGIAAPLIWVWNDKLSCIVPYDVAGRVTVGVQVEYKGQLSSGLQFTVTDAAPGVFTLNQQGSGQGAILNQDYSVNGPLSTSTRPAARGSVVMIYATGEGQTSPAGVDGKVNSSQPYPAPQLPVSIVIGGLEAEVLYAGAAPGFVSGALQINVRVPAGVSPGDDVAVQVRVGARSAQSNVTMTVQ